MRRRKTNKLLLGCASVVCLQPCSRSHVDPCLRRKPLLRSEGVSAALRGERSGAYGKRVSPRQQWVRSVDRSTQRGV